MKKLVPIACRRRAAPDRLRLGRLRRHRDPGQALTQTSTAPPATPAPQDCTNALQSYAPEGAMPAPGGDAGR